MVMGVTDRIGQKRLKKYHGGELAVALTIYASTITGIVSAGNEVGWHRWLETLLNAFHANAEKAREHAKRSYDGVDVCSGRSRKRLKPKIGGKAR
jgi:hypothetical protein